MINEHLIVETNEELNYLKVTCKENHYITNWDKKDILRYFSARVMYCPLNTDLSVYWCVTEEENLEYLKQQTIAAEELRKKSE